jgi:type III secretory pathway component EscS
VDDVRAEVLSHHTVPATAVLVHLRLEVTRQDALLLVLLQTLTQTREQDLFYLVDLLRVHV